MSRRLALLALIAGCATPSTPAAEVTQGEGVTSAAGTISTPSPVARPAAPRPTPSKASRGRPFTGLTARDPGSRLSVTCYAATSHRTASGKWPRVGMAASNHYPFGTRLRVEHVGIVTVEDRIGWGSDLDLFGPSESYCRNFGRQRLRVQVVR